MSILEKKRIRMFRNREIHRKGQNVEVVTHDSALHKRGAFNGKENQMWNEIFIGHRNYYLLSFMLFFMYERDGLYQRIVMECTANGIGKVPYRNGNVIKVKSSVQPVEFLLEVQPRKIREVQNEEEVNGNRGEK